MAYRIAVRARYDAALYLPGEAGPAGRTHGHGYTVEAVLESAALDEAGFVLDFERIEARLKAIAAELDHRLLNELEPFRAGSPSAERQAEFFFRRLGRDVGREFGSRVHLARVRVIQEPDAWAEYDGGGLSE